MSQTATHTSTDVPQGSASLRLRPITPPSPSSSPIECIPLQPTFGAEVRGIDFTQPLTDDTVDQLRSAVGKYGVVVIRKTGLTDPQFVNIGERFGEIYQSEAKRFPTKNMSDPSNIYPDGSLVSPGDFMWYMRKETALFHKDTTYDARRARWTAIICHLPTPAGTGGATEFGDTRALYDDLDPETKQYLLGKVGVHSHFHSRKVALPTFPTFAELDPYDYPMHKHDLVIDSLGSPGRKDLYIASHLHHIDGMDKQESDALILKLRKKVEEPKYVLKMYYENPGGECALRSDDIALRTTPYGSLLDGSG